MSLAPRGFPKSEGLFNLHGRISAHVMKSYPVNAVLQQKKKHIGKEGTTGYFSQIPGVPFNV